MTSQSRLCPPEGWLHASSLQPRGMEVPVGFHQDLSWGSLEVLEGLSQGRCWQGFHLGSFPFQDVMTIISRYELVLLLFFTLAVPSPALSEGQCSPPRCQREALGWLELRLGASPGSLPGGFSKGQVRPEAPGPRVWRIFCPHGPG